MNDPCNAVASGTPNATTSYFKYEVATMNAACTPSTTPTTAVAIDLLRTICCRYISLAVRRRCTRFSDDEHGSCSTARRIGSRPGIWRRSPNR